MKRILIKITLFSFILTGFLPSPLQASNTPQSDTLKIQGTAQTSYKPLQTLTIETNLAGVVSVLDGEGDIYHSEEIKETFSFQVGGALGKQQVLLLDKKGKLLDQLFFSVHCKTEINDKCSGLIWRAQANYRHYSLLQQTRKSFFKIHPVEAGVFGDFMMLYERVNFQC